MEKYREKAEKETKTSALITNGKLLETIAIPVAIRGRFLLNDNGTGDESFGRIATRLQNLRASNRFKTMATFAMDSIEMLKIEQKIRERMAHLTGDHRGTDADGNRSQEAVHR